MRYLALMVMANGLVGCNNSLDAQVEKCVSASVRAQKESLSIKVKEYESWEKAQEKERRNPRPKIEYGVPIKMADGRTFTPLQPVPPSIVEKPEMKPDSVIESDARMACLRAAGGK